jgi:methylated-DNA-[protein]-cysteine S-methyltransferase
MKVYDIFTDFLVQNQLSPALQKRLINMLEAYLAKQKTDFGDELADVIMEMDISDKQKLVMQNLMQIPYGTTVSYSEFAKNCKMEAQVRHLASLIGKNPIPIIIPCHRVIRKNGDIGGYIFGCEFKKYLLEFEQYFAQAQGHAPLKTP